MSEVLIEVTRGPLVETMHRGDVAVVDAAGRLVAAVGGPRAKVAFWRSSAKPFQCLPVVAAGAADRFGLGPQDLALFCGSHNGEPVHVARAEAVLRRIGLGAAALACGAHPPLDGPSAAALRRDRAEPSALHNNCSGKHAGMLALAVHLGADPRRYLEPGQPVQREILASVRRFTGLADEEIALGVDGCGVPCFGIAVDRMALAFARLMDPSAVVEPHRGAAGRVRAAMLAHPYLVAGRDRFDTALMALGGGRILAKGGASGVQCVGLEGGLGVALKIEDGAAGPGRAREVATVEVLRQLGALDAAGVAALGRFARPVVRNVAGREVGEARAALR
ncbi:MAG: asparaginase, partial [Candidatus Limnocylindria bacterium]